MKNNNARAIRDTNPTNPASIPQRADKECAQDGNLSTSFTSFVSSTQNA